MKKYSTKGTSGQKFSSKPCFSRDKQKQKVTVIFFAYAGQMVKKNIDPPQQKERKGDANSEKN